MSHPSPEEATGRDRIRHAAFALIAAEGVRAATLRAIARAAGVSPALVIHHYGSKQGVVTAVEEWVQALLRSSTADEGGSDDPARANAQRAAAFESLLVETPHLRSYVRRMLLEESPEGLEWFARVVTDGAGDLRRRQRTGMARTSGDVEAVAAILSVLALAPLLLPGHLARALGEGGEGTAVTRWQVASAELLRSALYPEADGTSPAAGADTAGEPRPSTGH